MGDNLRGYLAELVGTFALVFLGATAVCANQAALQTEVPELGRVGLALVNGLALAVALAIVLPHSNGYLNPAIALMLWVFKKMDTPRMLFLIGVQAVGATLAGGLVRLVFSEVVLVNARLGTPHLKVQDISRGILLSGVGIEAGLTFVLTMVIFATIIDPRGYRPGGRWLLGLWPGLALFLMSLAAYPITGASANPARWFGTVVWELTLPALARTAFEDQVVYWFGPAAGALAAGVLYLVFIHPGEEAPAPAVAPGSRTPAGTPLTRQRA